MKNKRKSNTLPLLAACIVIAAVAVVFAFKYRERLLPQPTTSVNLTQQQPTETEAVTVPPTKATESETENASEKETVLNILNCPDLKGSYEPTAFEAKLFNAINEKRAEKGLSALNWNNCLHVKAKERADEAVKSFSHTRPDGRKPSTVLSDGKITFSLFGECLAKGAREDDAGVNLLINGFLKDDSRNAPIFSNDYLYAASAVSVDESGLVTAVVLLCNP